MAQVGLFQGGNFSPSISSNSDFRITQHRDIENEVHSLLWCNMPAGAGNWGSLKKYVKHSQAPQRQSHRANNSFQMVRSGIMISPTRLMLLKSETLVKTPKSGTTISPTRLMLLKSEPLVRTLSSGTTTSRMLRTRSKLELLVRTPSERWWHDGYSDHTIWSRS